MYDFTKKHIIKLCEAIGVKESNLVWDSLRKGKNSFMNDKIMFIKSDEDKLTNIMKGYSTKPLNGYDFATILDIYTGDGVKYTYDVLIPYTDINDKLFSRIHLYTTLYNIETNNEISSFDALAMTFKNKL